MFISTEFFDQLCPSYQKVIKELDDNINKIQSNPNDDCSSILQQKLFENFFANYLMPKEYWQIYERFKYLKDIQFYKSYDKREKKRLKEYEHFYFSKNTEPPSEGKKKLYNFYPYPGHAEYVSGKICWMTGKAEDLFPHSYIKECFQNFERNSLSPPTKHFIQQYEKMKQLYQKIITSEADVEEWFKYLYEVGDIEFLIDNVENRLGENFLDKKLWKLYIKFLETYNVKKMLEIYSKYCRFFLDDSEMRKEYKLKAEKYGPIFVKWDTVFAFEKKANENDSKTTLPQTVNEEMNNTVQKSAPINKSFIKNFYQNYHKQIFPFQKPLMEYILGNENATVWRKLYQTCKYFFAKKLVPICYNLQIREDGPSKFIQQSLELNLYDNENNYLKNTSITTTLICRYFKPRQPGISDDYYELLQTNYLSRIISRLHRCDAKYIEIWKQKLSFNELKFLIGSGNVIDLSLPNTRIMDDQNEWIDLEKIMEFLPNIEKLQLSNAKFNKNTANILESRKFNSKINQLILMDIFGEEFGIDEFFNFCNKNRDAKLFLKMKFKPHQPGISNEFITNLRNLMEAKNNLKKTHLEINYTV